MLPPIKGLIENTLLDWEGRLAAVVFLPGCNYRCGYCHARHLLSHTDQDEAIPIQHVLASLLRDRNWVDGVVISGGEPTLHASLRELIELFRESDVPVKLDTNGSRPKVLESLLEDGLLDYVAMDVKAPLDERYEKVVRQPVNLDAVRACIELLIESDIGYEFRTTVCPESLAPDDVVDTAKAVRGAALYYLQRFRPWNCLDETLHAVKPYNDEQMRDLAGRCAKYVRRCIVRGDAASEVTHPPAAPGCGR